MKITLLGPFSVEDDDTVVALGRGTERALLAFMALHPDTPQSAERIVEALWSEPPPTARDMVRVYVGRVRARVGDALGTDGGGYVLRVPRGDIDLFQFDRARLAGVEALESGDAATA